jgi:hypothetical protein
MAEEHGGFVHELRGHIGFSALSGVLIAATGAGPDDWFRKLFEKLPEFATQLWPANWDLRLVPVTMGMLLFAGDLAWHHHRHRSKPESQPQSAPAPPGITVFNFGGSAPDNAAARDHDPERPRPIPQNLPRSIGELFKGRADVLRQLHMALT